MVVNNGPEAMAGSVRIRRRSKGTNPPKLTATSVLAARETPTTSPRYGDITSSMLDIYLSMLSNRMNEVMKVLYHHCHHLYPLDLHCRHLRNEFRNDA